MRKGFCEIVCVIDRSGSMQTVKEDAIGGFNTFIEKQRELEGEASVTFVQFDDRYELVYENKPLKDVPLLNDKTFEPRGMTALLDAMGKTINSVGDRLAKTAEKDRPEKVIMVILTDGEENHSKEFTRDVVFNMVDHQRNKYSWEFIFLAADQDAIDVGRTYGFLAPDCVSYCSADGGTRTVCASSMHGCVTNYRMSVSINNTDTGNDIDITNE